MSIESKIKRELGEYEIKTTSDDILAKLPERKKFNKRIFGYSLGFSFCTIILVIALILNLGRNNSGSVNTPGTQTPNDVYIVNNSKLNDTSTISRASLELYYAGMMTGDASVELQSLNFDEFSEAIDKYKNISKLIDDLYYKSNEGLISIYENVNFEYNDVKYNYRLSIDDFYLYSENDINKNEYSGDALINIGDSYYDALIEIETKNNEAEVEISYYVGNNIVSIEREKESTEFEFEYVIRNKKTNEELLVQELEIEYDENDDLEINYHYMNRRLDINYSFEIVSGSDGYRKIEYFINEIKVLEFKHKNENGIDEFFDKIFG